MRNKRFAYWLRRQMEARGYNVMDLAERLGVKHPTVSRWRTGQHLPDVPNLVRLDRLLR